MDTINRATVEAEIAAMVERLDEWGRWARPASVQGRCASLEGRYVPDEEDRPKPSATQQRAEPNVHRAMEIERIIAAPTFPKPDRVLLVQTYVWKRNSGQASRQARIAHKHYERALRDAHLIVINRLRMVGYLRSRNLHPHTSTARQNPTPP
jgi:hypothetical protein